jgi:FHS family glucose/mannose:H+ symporter-like MFS transporter
MCGRRSARLRVGSKSSVAAARQDGPDGLGRAATVITYCAFAATGIGVELPGTLLSSLLTRWSLNDQQAGLLFFLFFIGSSGGALLSRGMLPRSIARGCGAIAAGVCMLAIASPTAAFVAMVFFGLGLGLTMTSISLLQSRRQAEARTAEMARLNLTWALGASIGPALLLRGVAQWSIPTVLYATAAVFALFALLAVGVLPNVKAPAVSAARSSSFRLGAMPLLLLALVPLATGVESSVGGWLAAYSKRDGLMLNQTISTVTCFWAGILVSRLVQSHRSMAVRSQAVTLKFAPWLMTAGLLLLLMGRGELPLLAGAALLGFGVGPIYPLVLALLLGHGEAGNIVFLAGGIGASSLPLLTGLVSGWTGSLGVGLTVPLAASVVMGVLGLASQTQRSGWRTG